MYQAHRNSLHRSGLYAEKGRATCHGVGGMVVLTFLVLLLGAAMIANMSNGPMHEYRGSWTTRASR